MIDKGLELLVEGGKFRVIGDGVEEIMIPVISLGLPDMDCTVLVSVFAH